MRDEEEEDDKGRKWRDWRTRWRLILWRLYLRKWCMRFDSGVQLQPSGKSSFVPLVLRARRIGAVRVRIEGIARIVDVGSIVEAFEIDIGRVYSKYSKYRNWNYCFGEFVWLGLVFEMWNWKRKKIVFVAMIIAIRTRENILY